MGDLCSLPKPYVVILVIVVIRVRNPANRQNITSTIITRKMQFRFHNVLQTTCWQSLIHALTWKYISLENSKSSIVNSGHKLVIGDWIVLSALHK